MLSIGWRVAKNDQAVYNSTHIEQMLSITDKARRLGGDHLNVTFPVAVHLIKGKSRITYESIVLGNEWHMPIDPVFPSLSRCTERVPTPIFLCYYSSNWNSL